MTLNAMFHHLLALDKRSRGKTMENMCDLYHTCGSGIASRRRFANMSQAEGHWPALVGVDILGAHVTEAGTTLFRHPYGDGPIQR